MIQETGYIALTSHLDTVWRWTLADTVEKFIEKSENITVGELLDIWAEEELKTGTLSNGTVQNYLGAITNIKKHPISERKLKNVTSEHLQAILL